MWISKKSEGGRPHRYLPSFFLLWSRAQLCRSRIRKTNNEPISKRVWWIINLILFSAWLSLFHFWLEFYRNSNAHTHIILMIITSKWMHDAWNKIRLWGSSNIYHLFIIKWIQTMNNHKIPPGSTTSLTMIWKTSYWNFIDNWIIQFRPYKCIKPH